MKSVKQGDNFGCAIACIAFVLNIKYVEATELFINGKQRAKRIPNFYCKEINIILKNAGLDYQYKYVKTKIMKKIYTEKAIVFIERSKRYRFGHYLVRYKNQWMDPWINLPDKNIKAGFRKRLPGKAIYVLFQ